jgi:CrcB protein
VDAAVPHTLDAFALSTLIVNVIGALLLGLTVGALWSRLPHWGRAGLGAGILGSFTTFSALTNSIIALALAGDVFTALITVGLHLALGLAAAFAGLELGSRASGGRARTQTIDEVDE